jgi:hypothetical protein
MHEAEHLAMTHYKTNQKQKKTKKQDVQDRIDMGVGLNIGLTTGGKARLIATLEPGVVVGVDLDIGTIIFISELTASGILGWSFQPGNHVIRPYVTAGAGQGILFAILVAAAGPVSHLGGGIEWKPARWLGLGLEGGVNTMHGHRSAGMSGERESDQVIHFPYARLNLMFYFL